MYGRRENGVRETGVRSKGLKAETEGLIIAVQDQCLPTKSYFARIGRRTAPVHCAVFATSKKKQQITSYLAVPNLQKLTI